MIEKFVLQGLKCPILEKTTYLSNSLPAQMLAWPGFPPPPTHTKHWKSGALHRRYACLQRQRSTLQAVPGLLKSEICLLHLHNQQHLVIVESLSCIGYDEVREFRCISWPLRSWSDFSTIGVQWCQSDQLVFSNIVHRLSPGAWLWITVQPGKVMSRVWWQTHIKMLHIMVDHKAEGGSWSIEGPVGSVR